MAKKQCMLCVANYMATWLCLWRRWRLSKHKCVQHNYSFLSPSPFDEFMLTFLQTYNIMIVWQINGKTERAGIYAYSRISSNEDLLGLQANGGK